MKYLLPVGTKITRRIDPSDVRSDYGYDTWCEFVTTKDAYYTTNDIIEKSQHRMTFIIPPTVHGSTIFDRIEANVSNLVRVNDE